MGSDQVWPEAWVRCGFTILRQRSSGIRCHSRGRLPWRGAQRPEGAQRLGPGGERLNQGVAPGSNEWIQEASGRLK